MKPNPKNFEAFIDPEGGEWIKIKNGKFKDIVWRPVDMKMESDDQMVFSTEFLGPVPEDINTFEKLSGSIIKEILISYTNDLKEEFVDENSDSNSSKD
jgi:hypothetical protein